MDKKQFIITLQSALFNFDGADEKEILKLNSDYPPKLVRAGIQMCEYLKSIK
jgi:hypothetical protein